MQPVEVAIMRMAALPNHLFRAFLTFEIVSLLRHDAWIPPQTWGNELVHHPKQWKITDHRVAVGDSPEQDVATATA